MASIMGHAFAGLAIGWVWRLLSNWELTWWIIFLCGMLGMAPDLDMLLFFLGVEYDSTLGHRGFFHSLSFALFLSCSCMLPIYFSYSGHYSFLSPYGLPLWMLFWVSMVSHGCLDTLTNGGMGVAFFSPFWKKRFIFRRGPIKVSPMGVEAFCSHYGLEVIESEYVYIAGPSSALVMLATFVKLILASMYSSYVMQLEDWVIFGIACGIVVTSAILVAYHKEKDRRFWKSVNQKAQAKKAQQQESS